MSCNVVIIGGGSLLWTERFAVDLFLQQELSGSRLVLVDTDHEAREMVADVCRIANQTLSATWEIATAEMDEALADADFVIVQISTGGLEAFDLDYRLPAAYGVYHSVADTVGPGGISRVLRNVPVFLDIAGRMERLCPDAWMIHVTNPLAQLTRCLTRASPIKVVGLCHNYEGTMRKLADYLGVERQEVDAETYGVNHFTWLRDITCKGAPCQDQLSLERYLDYHAKQSGVVKTGTTDDDIEAMTGGYQIDNRLAYELLELTGHFPVGDAAHIAENFPYFLNDKRVIHAHRIRRKGVLPNRQEGKERKRLRVQRILAGQEEPRSDASSESLADIVQALHGGTPCRACVNLPNTGQIENLSSDVIVETMAEVDSGGIRPSPSSAVPTVLKGFLESIIAEEELAVEAALSGDRKLVVQAMFASPLLHDKDAAEKLTDDLLAAHQAYLPQFNKGDSR